MMWLTYFYYDFVQIQPGAQTSRANFTKLGTASQDKSLQITSFQEFWISWNPIYALRFSLQSRTCPQLILFSSGFFVEFRLKHYWLCSFR